MLDEEEVIATIYNLILNPNTREWERTLLRQTKKNGWGEGFCQTRSRKTRG